MKRLPPVGSAVERTFVVEEKHAIDFATDGMPAVLCTPWLVWFLEHAAREVMLPFLEPGESTVGRVVEIEHLAATPVGGQVKCRARVVRVEAPEVAFQLEAFDEQEAIARGFHRLRVIRVERFAERMRRKASRKS
jgi:predicted thioesterase